MEEDYFIVLPADPKARKRAVVHGGSRTLYTKEEAEKRLNSTVQAAVVYKLVLVSVSEQPVQLTRKVIV